MQGRLRPSHPRTLSLQSTFPKLSCGGDGVVGPVEQLGREGGARVAALVGVDLHREPQVVLLEVGRLERHRQHLAQAHLLSGSG